MNATLVLASMAFAVGCGRIAFGTVTDSGATTDAADAAIDTVPACSAFGPWSAPERIPELSTFGNDWGGQISPDGLTYYYQSDASVNAFFVAQRASRSVAFMAPVQITEIDASAAGDIMVTRDDRELYFEMGAGAAQCIHASTRAISTAPWGTPIRLSALCTIAAANCPYLTPDGLSLYFFSKVNNRIAVTTRANPSDPFPAGTDVPNLPIGGGCPSLSGDQLTLYYERGSPLTLNVTTRASITDSFDVASVRLFPASTSNDADVSITADGLELYFGSDRPGGAGAYDIYRITRACL